MNFHVLKASPAPNQLGHFEHVISNGTDEFRVSRHERWPEGTQLDVPLNTDGEYLWLRVGCVTVQRIVTPPPAPPAPKAQSPRPVASLEAPEPEADNQGPGETNRESEFSDEDFSKYVAHP